MVLQTEYQSLSAYYVHCTGHGNSNWKKLSSAASCKLCHYKLSHYCYFVCWQSLMVNHNYDLYDLYCDLNIFYINFYSCTILDKNIYLWIVYNLYVFKSSSISQWANLHFRITCNVSLGTIQKVGRGIRKEIGCKGGEEGVRGTFHTFI